jgi:hypothetical protein
MMSFLLKNPIAEPTLRQLVARMFSTTLDRICIASSEKFFGEAPFEVPEDIDCLCVYQHVQGDCKVMVDLFRYADMPEHHIKNIILSVCRQTKTAVYIDHGPFDYVHFDGQYSMWLVSEGEPEEGQDVAFSKHLHELDPGFSFPRSE